MRFQQADGILDLRSAEAFQAGHLKASTWLSWQMLPDSLNELPATSDKAPAILFLVGDKQEIEAASVFLDSKGYEINGSLVIENQAEMERWAVQLPGLVVSDNVSKTLWSPSLLVKEFVEQFGSQLNPKTAKPRLNALDIGCGGGRDAVFLAQHGWQVSAIDQEARVLKRAKQLAAKSGASVKFKCCDLKKSGCFPTEKYNLITVVRYLNRELFQQIDDAIAPGGYLVYQTFTLGAEVFGSPRNPSFILREAELSEVFADYQIIVDRIDKLPDGRPMASFIGKKRA